MTPRQKRFVAEYLKDGNGTQAAIRAGYAKKTAAAEASRLLRNAVVREALGKLQRKLDITEERILRNIWNLGEMATGDAQYSPALKAQEMMGRHLGMWPIVSRSEISGPGGGAIPVATATVVIPIEALDADQREALRTALLQAKAKQAAGGQKDDDRT